MPTENPFRQLFADLAELRQRANLLANDQKCCPWDHRIIVDAARAQSRTLIAHSRRLAHNGRPL